MKKFLLGSVLLISAVALLACGALTTGNSTTLTEENAVFTDVDDVVTFQAVSATELLISSQESAVLLSQPLSFTNLASVSLLEDDEEDEPIVADEIDIVDQYLTMMEQFLGDDNGLSVTVLESDRPEYAVQVVYVTRNLLGENITYTLYYNETIYETELPDDGELTTTTETETETTETTEIETTETETTEIETTETEPIGYRGPNRERDFEFESDDEEEILYSIEGILIIGDLTYQLEGKKIVEEDEEIMMMHSYIDHENYVKVRFQTDLEDGKQKFFYEVKVDGVITNRSKVMVENDPEDGELKARLEFIDGDASGKYEFKSETIENVTYIKIKYEVRSAEGTEEEGMIHIQATYDELTDVTTYEYVLRPENAGSDHMIDKDHQEHHHGKDDRNDDDDNEGDDDSAASGDEIING